ncbi:nuclear fragile X mental retardation-interacting protein 1 isoform X2 [Spodoptera litura]|nr:nuclear fragile X mental retardation-interacting protein 1 isoform X2 [Spodoptera litura]
MMNNFGRGHMPHQNHWRPRGPPRLPWNNPRFGPPVMKTENQNSEEHWCETCDRGFPTEDILEKHKQQHQKCNIDGCQFVAHPKVITKHIQMQHSTGLYKKIANLNNPEEIQKWREERKKKYPTKVNIEKKEAEHQEKIARGEKMNLNRDHRNHRKQSSQDGPGVKRKLGTDKRNQNPRTNRQNWGNRQNSNPNTISMNTSEPPKKKPKNIPTPPATVEKNKLKPFAGILSIQMDDSAEEVPETEENSNELFDDDYDATIEVPKETSNKNPVLCGALTSLMCEYGSTDEETEEKENEEINKLVVPDKKEVESLNESKIKPIEDPPKVEKNESDDDDAPEEVKIEKNNVEHDAAQEITIKNKEKPVVKSVIPPKNVEKPNYKTKRKVPSTLLQKLLQNEIRQERNIVLQCIRYIKKNNYFEKSNQ